MRIAYVMTIGAIALAGVTSAASPAATQDPAPAPQGGRGRQGGAAPAGGGRGPNYPAHQRVLADAETLARGKGLYEANCAACHGVDLRGGQQGGPNLLRSQTLLSDKAGELILPIVQGGRPNPPAGAPPMPAFPLPPDAVKAIAEYLHSVLARAGRQGRPPEGEVVPPEQALVGNAAAGQKYFGAKCGSCHSPTGDLKGLAGRVADPRELQNLWVSGGGGRGGASTRKPATVTVTSASGVKTEGRLVRMDDFFVVLIKDDGTRQTIARKGSEPKVDVRDPADAHRALIQSLADKDMHDVTAFLWSLK